MPFLHPLAGSIFLAILISEFAVAQQTRAQAASSPLRHPASVPALAAGGITNGVYRNPDFGFSYKIPFGWVDRTAEMREPDANQAAPDSAKAQVLLGVFERPPEATGETINSAVIIAAESVSAYPGLKSAVDYFGPLEDATTAKGFKVVNEPYEFPVGTRRMVREDFSKELGKLTMQQSSLVIVEKGYAVSFTFLGSSDDDIAEQIEGLSFATASHKR